MKKRTLSFLFVVILACACVLTFAACNGDGGDHVHTYTDTVVSPTLESEGYTIHICSVCQHEYKDNFVDKLTYTVGDTDGNEGVKWETPLTVYDKDGNYTAHCNMLYQKSKENNQ